MSSPALPSESSYIEDLHHTVFGSTLASTEPAATRASDAVKEKAKNKVECPKNLEEDLALLQQNPATSVLMERALALNTRDIKIKLDAGDDTRWDRQTGTIYISRSKKGPAIRAALLFELNNAANPHAKTNAVESRMAALSERDVRLTGPDYFRIAQEMEKDEFDSLQAYRDQVEAMGGSESHLKTMREKYMDLIGEHGQLDYEKFVQQNIASGHTMELAKAQYAAYTGRSPDELGLIMPLRLQEPNNYKAFMKAELRPRSAEKVGEQIEADKVLDRETAELFPDPQQVETDAPDPREQDSGSLSFKKWSAISSQALTEVKVTRLMDRPLQDLLKMAYEAGYTPNMFVSMMENGTW